MTRFVITPDVAFCLANESAVIGGGHKLLAPTLLRSQFLTLLYRAVREGKMTKKEADDHLAYLRSIRIRLLGDRVLQSLAWTVADQLRWPDTFDAEYVALTQLQADAFITLDRKLASAVEHLIQVAPFEALSAS